MTQDPPRLLLWRCYHCGALLMKLALAAGHIECKCPRCGTLNVRTA